MNPTASQPAADMMAADDKATSVHHLDDTTQSDTKLEAATAAVTEARLTSAFASASRREILRKFWRLYGIGLAASFGGLYAGYCLSATGNIVANPGFVEFFGTVENPATGAVELDATYVSLWSGMVYVGQVVFQIISPFITDRFGRKAGLYCLTGSMLIASLAHGREPESRPLTRTQAIILEIVAQDWRVFLAAKLLSGASNAFLGTGVMTYMSEIAMPQIRGALLGAFSLSFGLGQLFNAVGLQILVETSPMAFRNAFYSQFVIFGIFTIIVICLPESPAWLASRGNHEKAKRSLRRLIGKVEGYDLEHEYAVLHQEQEVSRKLAESQGKTEWAALFKWINFKRVIAATLPYSFQNFVGTPLVFGQTTYFFSLAGLEDAFLGSTIISVILIVGIIVSFFTVEKVGRRPSVLYGGAALAVIDFAIGGIGFKEPFDAATGAGLITLCSIWVFIYSLSLAPIGWTALVEVSSPRLRAKTAGVASVIQSLSNVLFAYVVPFMLSPQYAGWGSKIGLFFGGLTILVWIPCYFLFPETKGRTYQELDQLYALGVSPRHFAKTHIETPETGRAPDDASALAEKA